MQIGYSHFILFDLKFLKFSKVLKCSLLGLEYGADVRFIRCELTGKKPYYYIQNATEEYL